MKFRDVNLIPEKRFDKPFHKSVTALLEQFAQSSTTMVLVETDPGEYASTESIVAVINQAIRRSGFRMKVCKRGNDIYVKKDY